MDMNKPAPRNPLDDNRQGLIGQPLDRVDGRMKVMGQAPCAYEVREGGNPACGFIVEATIGKGRVADIDARAAERAPGVLLVYTHKNAPKQAKWGPLDAKDRFARSTPQMRDDRVAHYGQAVAFVVAQTFEHARSAARLVKVVYAPEAGAFDMKANLARAETPADQPQQKMDSAVWNFGDAFATAAVTVDSSYTTPVHIHAQMEPHATLAYWQDGRVHIHCAAQLLESAQKAVANTLQISPDKVRIVSRFVGGGFGGKLPVYGDVMLSAMAARTLERPVKTALTRQQMFHFTSHRSATAQRVRLGATREGVLTAIGHDSTQHCARFDNFVEPTVVQTRALYAGANRLTTHRLLKLDLPVGDSTRAPGEAVGMLALEQAMDELAEKLQLDPIELRVRNEPAADPELQVPYSTRQLVRCMREGAQRFGWSERRAVPAQRREGRWLIGMGMAAAIRGNLLLPSKCSVSVDQQGMVEVRMSMTDIGIGSYTVFTQIAAEMLGVPMTRVRMLLGDSDFPETPGSGGSFGAASAGSGLFDAWMNLRTKLAERMGVDVASAEFVQGQVMAGGRTRTLAELAGAIGVQADGEIKPGAMTKKFSQQAYGAHFAEVAVNADTGEVKLRRMLGVFAAGRILNLKTATSQATGAMIWSVGSALHEQAEIDRRHRYFVNNDLAGYHVPSHADIPAIEAYFVDEVDDKTNPLKIKGLGELGISGAGAAIANAVYNACGARVRDYPITLDKVLAAIPAGR